MKKVDFRFIFEIGTFVALALIYAVLWARMIQDPVERTGTDFIAFYAAGRVAREHGIDQVYDPVLQQAVQEQVVGFRLGQGQVLLYNHLPYLVPMLMLFVDGVYIASFLRWVLGLVFVFLIGAGVLMVLLQHEGWHGKDLIRAFAGLLVFFPFFVSVLNGQDTVFIFLGLSLWLFGMLTGRDWLAGLGLALCTVRPHIAVVLALPFLFRRQKVFGWFCIGALGLGITSLLMLGWGGTRAYLEMLRISAAGEFFGMHESAMVNLVGWLTRYAPGMGSDLIHAFGWGGMLAAVVGLCILWQRSRVLEPRQLGLAVLLAVFFVPHLHYHDLTLLLIPLICVFIGGARGSLLLPQAAGAGLLGVSLVLLLGSLVPGVKYDLPLLVMIGIEVLLWFPEKLLIRRKHALVP
jgi:hypothetical protein